MEGATRAVLSSSSVCREAARRRGGWLCCSSEISFDSGESLPPSFSPILPSYCTWQLATSTSCHRHSSWRGIGRVPLGFAFRATVLKWLQAVHFTLGSCICPLRPQVAKVARRPGSRSYLTRLSRPYKYTLSRLSLIAKRVGTPIPESRYGERTGPTLYAWRNQSAMFLDRLSQ